jgi:hypothetical protein
LLTNFCEQKYPLVGRYLSATFPQKDYAGVCKFSRATARKKTFTLLSAPFTAAIACDFDSAVFS